jgi:hypothetical protein
VGGYRRVEVFANQAMTHSLAVAVLRNDKVPWFSILSGSECHAIAKVAQFFFHLNVLSDI